MKRLLFSLMLLTALFTSMCDRYPDNRNKDRNPAAQMDKDTVVHPDARRDSAEITDPHIHRSQHDSVAGNSSY